MLLCIPLLIKDERHYVSVITITKVGWNKRKHPVSLSLLLITAGRRKGSVFFNKAGVLYASTSYLPQHLWTVKVSSPLLLNPLIVLYLPHSTAAHSTRAAKTKLEALCTSLDSAALLFSSWKDAATSFPLASPPRSISSLLNFSCHCVSQSLVPTEQRGWGWPLQVTPAPARPMWCPLYCYVSCLSIWKAPVTAALCHGAGSHSQRQESFTCQCMRCTDNEQRQEFTP